MFTPEEIEARLTDYSDQVCNMEDAIREAADNMSLLAEFAFNLKKDQTVVLYGKDVTKDYFYRMEHAMDEMWTLQRKRAERFNKMRLKGDRHFNKIMQFLPSEIPEEVNALFLVVRKALKFLSSREPSNNLSEALELLSETMDAIHKLKNEFRNKGSLTPETEILFTEVQNLIFDSHNIFLNEQQQRNREEDLLTPEFRKHIERLEAMPRELLQAISDCTELRRESEILDEHVVEIINIFNESGPVFEPVERLSYIFSESGDYIDEEVEDFFIEFAEVRLFVADMTAMGRKFIKATDDLFERLKKAKAAFDYYVGELD